VNYGALRIVSQHLLPAVRSITGKFCTFQQGNAIAHRARETVEFMSWCTPGFIACDRQIARPLIQLTFMYGSAVVTRLRRDVASTIILKHCLVEEWSCFDQDIIHWPSSTTVTVATTNINSNWTVTWLLYWTLKSSGFWWRFSKVYIRETMKLIFCLSSDCLSVCLSLFISGLLPTFMVNKCTH